MDQVDWFNYKNWWTIVPKIYITILDKWVDNEHNIDGLQQDCRNSIANALELLQSCTEPTIYPFQWIVYKTFRKHERADQSMDTNMSSIFFHLDLHMTNDNLWTI